jgi:hypothetical protein
MKTILAIVIVILWALALCWILVGAFRRHWNHTGSEPIAATERSLG